MQAKTAPNGWPGMFIPGDEALAMASHMSTLANALEIGSIPVAAAAAFLRNTAAELVECKCDSRELIA